MLDPEVTAKIISMTSQQMLAASKNIYKATLRQLLHIFGNLYCYDVNNNLTKIRCSHGRPDRASGKAGKDNTLVLPFITLSESSVSNSDERRRYNPVLVVEKTWSKEEMRAKRVVSFPPRPLNISYNVNIWTKFSEDMDSIRQSIYSMFNPDMDIRTGFSDYTKAFIESDTDESDSEAQDGKDRTCKRSITLNVETYIPSPKFLYTNSSQIESYNADIKLFNNSQDIETDDPIETEEVRKNL